jgi:hypothetical protein
MTNKMILTIAVWLARPTPDRHAAVDAGWLGRHNSRPLRAAPRGHEPYVDLGPLDPTRRH